MASKFKEKYTSARERLNEVQPVIDKLEKENTVLKREVDLLRQKLNAVVKIVQEKEQIENAGKQEL